MRNTAPRNLTVAAMLLALAACSTDTPTAPERTPAPPPGSATTTAWNVTVSVAPRNLVKSATQPATITVQVRRASDSTRPQDGTTVVVSAGLGEFISAGSGTRSVVVTLSGGAAQLLYFAGAILGSDTIQAQIERSVGSAQVNILEQETLFIQTVVPNRGSESGGTRIRISGTGFSEPARVTLGTIIATVDAVGKDADGGFIRAFTGAVLDPKTFFGVEKCDSDGDGSLDGDRFVPKTVDVKVELPAAANTPSTTFPGGFTYRPKDTSCRDLTPAPSRPRADFSFVKSGLTVKFFNESSPGGVTSTWVFRDGSPFSSAESPTYTYALAGSYDVTLRVENESGSSSKTKTVTVP
jgi:hypothetical protein